MEDYSAINKNEFMSFAGKWIEMEIMLNGINQSQEAPVFCHEHKRT
jgi:hypothetical protein